MVKEGRNDHWYLEIARKKLEQKLGWGSVEQWSSEDFQTLSEAILASTDLSLSVTTLKRLVGRVNYNATPHPTTLNAVAVALPRKAKVAARGRLFAGPKKRRERKIPKASSAGIPIMAALIPNVVRPPC